MHLIVLTLLACGGDPGPTEATARASLERLTPAFEDSRNHVNAGLSGVSDYEDIDCSGMIEGMREMCQAQDAAQQAESEDQIKRFRDNVADRVN